MADKAFTEAIKEYEDIEKAKTERSEKRKPGETIEAFRETKDVNRKVEIAINEAIVGLADSGIDVKSGRVKLGTGMTMMKDGEGIYSARPNEDVAPDRKPSVHYKPIPKTGPWASMKKAVTGKTEYEDSVMVYISLNDAEVTPGTKDKDIVEQDTVIVLLAKYDKDGNLDLNSNATSVDIVTRGQLNSELGSNSQNARSRFLKGEYSQEAYSRNLFGIIPSAERLNSAGQRLSEFIDAEDVPFDERIKRGERVEETIERIRKDAEAVTYRERADNWEKFEYAKEKIRVKSIKHREVTNDYFKFAFDVLDFGRDLDSVHEDIREMGKIQSLDKGQREALVKDFETQRRKKIADQREAEKKRKEEELEEQRLANIAKANQSPQQADYPTKDAFLEAWMDYNSDIVEDVLDMMRKKKAAAAPVNQQAQSPQGGYRGGNQRRGRGGRNTP